MLLSLRAMYWKHRSFEIGNTSSRTRSRGLLHVSYGRADIVRKTYEEGCTTSTDIVGCLIVVRA